MKKLVLFFSVLITLLGLLLGYVYRQQLRDLYVVNFGSQQAEASALSNQLDLTSDGRFLYKASQPELLAAQDFNSA